ADSLELLREVGILINSGGYVINNLDAIIVAQEPKMAPYIEEMRNNVASVLNIEVGKINIKATTTEGLGFIGTGEGIAAKSIACITEK
ncbi:MAG: 2-C-methyl-D-erythritol 2,4-cyclodiphosphate synthase, partial [Syntrophomonadaceae bacterium]|nr:2-C-methyl-D-erythritol 2,4-cyclodiphosphate synthase [Syntrophomonadaceae bacterium]